MKMKMNIFQGEVHTLHFSHEAEQRSSDSDLRAQNGAFAVVLHCSERRKKSLPWGLTAPLLCQTLMGQGEVWERAQSFSSSVTDTTQSSQP